MADQTIILTGIAPATALGTPVLEQLQLSGLHSAMHTELGNTFFNLTEFAVPVAYFHQTGETGSYAGIFDDAAESVTFGAQMPMVSSSPRVSIMQMSFIRAPLKGDKCRINGIRYTVMKPMQDGVGVILLELHKEDR